jgi:hypothetical protein
MSKNSSNKMIALLAGGAVLALASVALGQGVQGPNTLQSGPTIAPGSLQVGKPAGAVDTFNKGPGAAGAVDAFNKGPGAAGFIWFNKGGPNPAGAEPPPSPAKGVGTQDAANMQVGPRAAGYLKSGTTGDPGNPPPGIRSCATGQHVC